MEKDFQNVWDVELIPALHYLISLFYTILLLFLKKENFIFRCITFSITGHITGKLCQTDTSYPLKQTWWSCNLKITIDCTRVEWSMKIYWNKNH